MAGEGSTFFLSPQGDTGGTVVGLRRIYHLAFLLKKTFGVWLGDPKGIQK